VFNYEIKRTLAPHETFYMFSQAYVWDKVTDSWMDPSAALADFTKRFTFEIGYKVKKGAAPVIGIQRGSCQIRDADGNYILATHSETPMTNVTTK